MQKGMKMMTPTADDPWDGIKASTDRWTGRRVEIKHPLSPFWAVHPNGAPGLVVRDVPLEALPSQLPTPKGIRVETEPGPDIGGLVKLTMFLEASQDREVFQQFCEDILAASASADSASVATKKLFERLGRWQSLLGFARGTALSDEEVRGLIGELWVLTRLIEPAIGLAKALEAWVAADHHPQDFAVASGLLEVKTRVTGSRHEIHISSLEQLDSGQTPLHLLVLELSQTEPNELLSLNEMVDSLLSRARQIGHGLEQVASVALSGWGYVPSTRYDALRYAVVGTIGFAVEGGFPRFMRSVTDHRISSAKYTLSLDTLGEYIRDLGSILPSY